MIKLALKHWLCEYCIDVAFDNISRNFYVPQGEGKYVGNRFLFLDVRQDDGGIRTFMDVFVMEESTNYMGIQFGSEYYTSSDNERSPSWKNLEGLTALVKKRLILQCVGGSS